MTDCDDLDSSEPERGSRNGVFKVFQQHLVNPGQNVIELQLHGSEAAHLSPGECHEQCRAEAMPFGIAYGDQKQTIRHEDEVEIISSGFVGGMRRTANVEARYHGCGGIEALLNIPRELQLELLLLLFSKLGDVMWGGNEVSEMAGFVTHGRDGLLRPEEFPGLLAINYHFLEGETVSELSPQLPVEFRVMQSRP
jgi:hypothetical protein